MGNSENDVQVDITANVSGLKRGTAEAKAALDGLSRSLNQPAAALNEVAKAGDRASASFSRTGVIIGTGIAIATAATWKLLKGTVDLADSLGDMSQRTGVAVKDLAGLKTISEQSGTSLNGVAVGLQRLNLSLGQADAGSKEYSAALQRLGVTAKDPKEALYQLADTVKKTGDNSKLAADMQKVFGRNWAELIPLLKQGGSGLRNAAAANEDFAESMARLAPDADRFNDQLTQIKTNSAGVAATFLSAVLPSLNEYVAALQDIIEKGSTLDQIKFFTLGYIPKETLDRIREAGDRVKDYNQEINRLYQNRMGLGKGAEDTWAYRQLTADIKRLEAERAVLIDRARANAAAKQAAPGTPDSPLPTAPTGIQRDPLAGLLGSTDIGRMAEFEKTVALLNARFDYGRKSSELYTQAMTKLVESTFANNFKEAANDAEFMRMVEEDGIKTTQEWTKNLRELANVDMSRLTTLLENTDFARLKKDQDDMVLLAKAFSEGIVDADGNLRKLSEAEYLDAVKNRLKLVGDEANDTVDQFKELKDAIEGWSRDAAQAMVDFAISGEGSVTDMVNGILEQMARLAVQKMITDPLFGMFESMLPTLLPTSGSAAVPNALGGVYSGAGISAYSGQVVSSPTVFPFARGIGLMGEAGPEAILPLTRVNGKLGVQAQGGGGNVSIEVHNYSGQPVQQRESTDSRGNRKIEVVVGEMVAAEMARPGSAVNSSVRGTFGASQQLVRR